MADILSQNEIDALLSAISTGEMDADELINEDKKKKERVYDFKRALRFSKDQFRSLTRIHENFARLLTSYLSAHLRTYVQISVASVDQLPYEEFVRSVPSMTILNVFEAEPLEGRMLIEVNPNIAYAMLDRLLGGVGASFNKIDNLTEIETRIISRMFKDSLGPFKEAWSTIEDLNPKVVDFEVNTQFLQIASPNETVVVISLSTTIGEVSGMMNVCIPHVVLEPIIQKLSMHHYWMGEKKKHSTPNDVEVLKERLHDTTVDLQAVLGESTLTIGELMQLDINDVISLDKRIEDPIYINVGPQRKFTGQPGKKNKNMAIQILDIIQEGVDVNES